MLRKSLYVFVADTGDGGNANLSFDNVLRHHDRNAFVNVVRLVKLRTEWTSLYNTFDLIADLSQRGSFPACRYHTSSSSTTFSAIFASSSRASALIPVHPSE